MAISAMPVTRAVARVATTGDADLVALSQTLNSVPVDPVIVSNLKLWDVGEPLIVVRPSPPPPAWRLEYGLPLVFA